MAMAAGLEWADEAGQSPNRKNNETQLSSARALLSNSSRAVGTEIWLAVQSVRQRVKFVNFRWSIGLASQLRGRRPLQCSFVSNCETYKGNRSAPSSLRPHHRFFFVLSLWPPPVRSNQLCCSATSRLVSSHQFAAAVGSVCLSVRLVVCSSSFLNKSVCCASKGKAGSGANLVLSLLERQLLVLIIIIVNIIHCRGGRE